MKQSKKPLRKKNNIIFLIHPTTYQDFDVICAGDNGKIYKLHNKIKGSQLFKSTKFGGIAMLLIDTFDTLSAAGKEIKRLRNVERTMLQV
jgi:hypothetical protein